MTNIEQAEIYAAQNAVEYLQEVGVYDLRELGEDRFKTLIQVVTKSYHEKIAELEQLTLDIPF